MSAAFSAIMILVHWYWKMEAVLEDAFVLLTDRKINIMKDLITLLEQVAKSARPIRSWRKTSRVRRSRR